MCQDSPLYDTDAWRAVITGYMLITIRGLTWQYARGQGRSLSPGEGYRCGSRGAYFVLPTAAILFSEGLEGPAWQDWDLRHRTAAKTRLEQRPMTEDPRRNAS